MSSALHMWMLLFCFVFFACGAADIDTRCKERVNVISLTQDLEEAIQNVCGARAAVFSWQPPADNLHHWFGELRAYLTVGTIIYLIYRIIQAIRSALREIPALLLRFLLALASGCPTSSPSSAVVSPCSALVLSEWQESVAYQVLGSIAEAGGPRAPEVYRR